MPVYLFTFHAYRSWMPGHPRGYTRRGEGYLATDEEAARQYAENAAGEAVLFDRALQRALIEEAQTACRHQQIRLHGGSTEPTHVHLLVSWKHGKSWMAVRTGLKTSLSLRLKREGEERDCQSGENDGHNEEGRWELRLSRGGSRKHVKDREHFSHLMRKYLPDHGGVKWFEYRGCGD
jgi:REP element-mobilizing transposase RayT